MAAGGEALPRDAGGAGDVLRDLRTATAEEHDRVESTLDLMDPHLDRDRLVAVLGRLHGFWLAAEAGLDAWAAASPGDAATVDWAGRRRTHLLSRGYIGLYVPNMIWRELESFSTNAVCLVLASTPYDETDYVRDHDEFVRLQTSTA